jgi:hypothetical protein
VHSEDYTQNKNQVLETMHDCRERIFLWRTQDWKIKMKTEQEIDSRCARVTETKKTNGKRKPGGKNRAGETVHAGVAAWREDRCLPQNQRENQLGKEIDRKERA